MDRDRQIAELIRQEVAKAEDHKRLMGYPTGSLEEVALRMEIKGLRRALAFIDPNPMED